MIANNPKAGRLKNIEESFNEEIKKSFMCEECGVPCHYCNETDPALEVAKEQLAIAVKGLENIAGDYAVSRKDAGDVAEEALRKVYEDNGLVTPKEE